VRGWFGGGPEARFLTSGELEVVRAVRAAVAVVFEEPATTIGPDYRLDRADSIDLVEIAELTEQHLRAAGLEVRLDDATLDGWHDLAGFAGNVLAQLGVWGAA
jgi:hypothetical protein